MNPSVGLFFDQSFTLIGIKTHLKEILGANVLGVAKSKSAAVDFLKTARPSLVLMDITLGAELCLDLVAHIAKRYPRVRVLVVSRQSENVFAERCIRAGAHGYVSSDWDIEEIDHAIKTVMSGEVFLSAASKRHLLGRMIGRDNDSAKHPVETLTRRELQVFVRAGHGVPPRKIALELDICVKTVETYRDKIKEKLGLRTSHEVSKFAMECVLFDFHESALTVARIDGPA